MMVLFLQFSPKGNCHAKERLAKCTEQEVEGGGQVSGLCRQQPHRPDRQQPHRPDPLLLLGGGGGGGEGGARRGSDNLCRLETKEQKEADSHFLLDCGYLSLSFTAATLINKYDACSI